MRDLYTFIQSDIASSRKQELFKLQHVLLRDKKYDKALSRRENILLLYHAL